MNKVFQVTYNNCVALLDQPLLMIMNPLNFLLRLLNAIVMFRLLNLKCLHRKLLS